MANIKCSVYNCVHCDSSCNECKLKNINISLPKNSIDNAMCCSFKKND